MPDLALWLVDLLGVFPHPGLVVSDGGEHHLASSNGAALCNDA
jgi:hypothetical protein